MKRRLPKIKKDMHRFPAIRRSVTESRREELLALAIWFWNLHSSLDLEDPKVLVALLTSAASTYYERSSPSDTKSALEERLNLGNYRLIRKPSLFGEVVSPWYIVPSASERISYPYMHTRIPPELLTVATRIRDRLISHELSDFNHGGEWNDLAFCCFATAILVVKLHLPPCGKAVNDFFDVYMDVLQEDKVSEKGQHEKHSKLLTWKTELVEAFNGDRRQLQLV